jgi:hypothetical protein
MAFSTGGMASGAAAGSTFGPWGTVIGGIAGGFLGGSKQKSVQLDPYAGMTPEQRQAMSLLQQFGATGQIGDFQAGEQYNLNSFNFDPNQAQVMGGNLLTGNLANGSATGITDAQNALTGMVNAKFDPTDPSNGFAAFQRQLARSTKGADDVINRDAAIMGSRFGSRIGRDKVDLAERQSDITASKLGDLWNQTQQNKLSAASGLNSIANSQENIAQSRIAQAFNIGQMQQQMQNQKAQMAYDEWQRSRNERLSSISSLQTVLSKGTTPMLNQGMNGANSYTYDAPNNFQQFLNGVNGGSGNSGGGAIMNLISGLFNKQPTQSQNWGSQLVKGF